MRRAILFAVALVLADCAAIAASPQPSCRSRPDLVGGCWTVHGRLFAANGRPSFRIWIVGTRRILGVSHRVADESHRPLLPANVWAAFGDGQAFGTFVYGDFEVCPFTRDRPGWMRLVCIASARNLVVREAGP